MNWDELIPELLDWSPPLAQPENLAASLGRYPLAISYLALFWPELIEYKGMVFRRDLERDGQQKNFDGVERWLTSLNGNKMRVEVMLNHFHVLDIQHPGIWTDATMPQVKYLGRVMKEMLQSKLALDFPDKKFVVEFFEGDAEDLRDYQVTFFQPSLDTDG